VSNALRIVALLMVTAIAGGCGSRQPPAAEGPAVDSAAIQRPAGEADSGFVVRGNEPFWSVTVGADGIRFQEPDRPDGVRGEYDAPVREGDRLVYRTVLRDTVDLPLELTIEKQPCSDGMSDRAYAYAAVARVGDRVLHSCAERR